MNNYGIRTQVISNGKRLTSKKKRGAAVSDILGALIIFLVPAMILFI